jgi:2,4-dienoyl-CoA reductase-like NADH-dependent reductase (Old Yellow Enzyme family)
MSQLFSPLSLRGLTLRNRVWLPPMCQYSAQDGFASDWHLVHLGARAAGGLGLVMVEATAVAPEGRISIADLGIWSDAHGQALARVAAFCRSQGAAPAIQLAHAGRKGSTDVPWRGGKPLAPEVGGWQTVAPSAVAFQGMPVPQALDEAGIRRIVQAFAEGARRAHQAGFEVAEIHMAHGYLLHEFLSPLSNLRTDAWGGDLEGRLRLPLDVARAVRASWPQHLPLFVRLSATDWKEGGWDLDSSITLARRLGELGVDLIDCSTGGLVADAVVPVAPGFQVPFAAAIRSATGLPVSAVGLITEAAQAEQVLANGHADAVMVGRELLRDPHWPLHAAQELGDRIDWPPQYLRARPA